MMTALRPLLFLLMLLPGPSAWCQEVDNTTDPWESMNRRIFAFNDTLDKYALLPAARGYQFIMPDPAEEGVGNFISNIYEFNSVFNFLLQGRPGDALQSAGRFLVNTTMGLAGLLDVATPMGIAHEPADFGQTLYTWGVDRGPYVVLPIFGPRTVRSATGYFVDTYTSLPSFAVERQWAYLFWVVEALDLRVDLMQAENLLSGDRYIFVRNAYLQRREYFLTGEIQDSFSIEEEGDEYIEF